MSTLSVTNIITADDTTDLTLKTGNTSGPEVVLYANGATNLNNIQTLSVGNSSVNTVTNSTSISIGSDVTVNTTAISVGNSTANVLMSNGNITINGNAVSPVQSFRNKIINGNFDFWQRGTSTSTSGVFCADRWRTPSSGSTFTTSRQAFTLGQTDVPGNPQYFSRTVVTSVAGAANFVIYSQPIEGVETLSGQTVMVSFWAKADASKNIVLELVQYFGSGGSPSSLVNTFGATRALTTSWQKFTVEVSIPSVAGKTLGTDGIDYLGLFFWFDAGSDYNSRTNSLGQQSGTFDIAQVQLETGSVATPFEMRPLGTELALCQRYYEVGGATNIFSGEVTSGTIYYHSVRFCALKRAFPSITTTHVGSNGFDTSNPVASSVTSADGFIVQKTATGTGPNGYYYYSWTAAAEI